MGMMESFGMIILIKGLFLFSLIFVGAVFAADSSIAYGHERLKIFLMGFGIYVAINFLHYFS
jgi:hypothetical protein